MTRKHPKPPRTLRYWARHREQKCGCGGYHFPHRKTGGACDHSKTRDIHLARRSGDRSAIEDATYEHQMKYGIVQQPGAACPF